MPWNYIVVYNEGGLSSSFLRIYMFMLKYILDPVLELNDQAIFVDVP